MHPLAMPLRISVSLIWPFECVCTQCTHQIRHNNVSWCNLRIVDWKSPEQYYNVQVLVWLRRGVAKERNSILLSEQIIEYFLLLPWFFSFPQCASKVKATTCKYAACIYALIQWELLTGTYTMLTNVVRVSTAIDIVCFRHWVQKRQFKINMKTTQTVREFKIKTMYVYVRVICVCILKRW